MEILRKAEHLEFTVRSLERLGVSAIIIEDKVGLKKILYLAMMLNRTRYHKYFVKKLEWLKKLKELMIF